MNFDNYTSPEAEELLLSAQQRYHGRRGPARDLAIQAMWAVLVLGAGALIAGLTDSARPLSVTTLVVVVLCYVAASSVDFPVGAAWTHPTQLVFVPMLFLLPIGWVPLVVVGATLLTLVPDALQGRILLTKALARIGDCAYSLGPTLVLVLAGDQQFRWIHWPIYLLAFGAQIVCDATAGLTRVWFAERIRPTAQMQMLWLYATDASLTCAGLLVAASAENRPGLALLALPIVALLGLFARERTERMENTLALSTAYRGTAMLLGDVIEDDDEYTGFHSRAVVDLSLAVAGRLGLGASVRRNVEFGALLHDVGKIRVPKEIIHKPGKLNDAEWAIMRQHTVFGEQMLRQVGGTLSSVGRVVRGSHERWDGTGYPDGLAGEAIPIEARIVCACDAFNAMTTHRPYRRAMGLAEACAELTRCSGTHFDPRVVYALLAEVTENPQILGPAQAGTEERAEPTRSTVSTA